MVTMIPQSIATVAPISWQHELANAITDPSTLLSQLDLLGQLTEIDAQLIAQFPLRVPQSYVNKMRKGDKGDPLLRQVFPLIDESLDVAGFVSDPVGDLSSVTSRGVLQKYQGRALLVTTGACAIHCRYCFRRHFPYGESNPLASQWVETLKALQHDLSLTEVILSGGDPLSLNDTKLAEVIQDIAEIPHIKTLRIHTRLPIVLPKRITNALCTLLSASRLKVVVVVHTNHANEIADEEKKALADLQTAGCLLLNQSVLLRGINDSVSALKQLSNALFDAGVLPYYLHLLDPVTGAHHFDVPLAKGKELIASLRTQLAGYLVPKLVKEDAGEASKTSIS